MECKVNVSIRPLQQQDAEFLCSIFKDSTEYYEIFYDSETSLTEWEKRVAFFVKQNKISHFIIEKENNAVGWISFFDIEPSERELGILVLKKEYIHCGYGAQSLLWFIKKSKAENIHRVLLNVNQSNDRAIEFYKSFGFEIFAEEIIPQCNDMLNLAQYKMQMFLV